MPKKRKAKVFIPDSLKEDMGIEKLAEVFDERKQKYLVVQSANNQPEFTVVGRGSTWDINKTREKIHGQDGAAEFDGDRIFLFLFHSLPWPTWEHLEDLFAESHKYRKANDTCKVGNRLEKKYVHKKIFTHDLTKYEA
jgi:hypothetical protein